MSPMAAVTTCTTAMRAAVIGGSLGGLAAAHALVHAGFRHVVDVYERAAGSAGQWIGLCPRAGVGKLDGPSHGTTGPSGDAGPRIVLLRRLVDVLVSRVVASTSKNNAG